MIFNRGLCCFIAFLLIAVGSFVCVAGSANGQTVIEPSGKKSKKRKDMQQTEQNR
jgi:hypothetical protein